MQSWLPANAITSDVAAATKHKVPAWAAMNNEWLENPPANPAAAKTAAVPIAANNNAHDKAKPAMEEPLECALVVGTVTLTALFAVAAFDFGHLQQVPHPH